MSKTAVVLGAGGFIGNHMVIRLKKEGYWVRGVDLKTPSFNKIKSDEFLQLDLTSEHDVWKAIPQDVDEVYQFAADMGGAGYVFTGDHDADIMTNSALINVHVAKDCVNKRVKKLFFASSACIYPSQNQVNPEQPICVEESAYPANPDSEYGWEKLFSERLYQSYSKNYGLPVKIARFHNIFGPRGTYKGGKEKAPAALCRKVIETPNGGTIEIWGTGNQTRSFLYIDECIEGVRRLMESDFSGPVNIGSDEIISISNLAKMIIEISGKSVQIKTTSGPTGVNGRNSDNKLIREKLGWVPTMKLREGLVKTYEWMENEIERQ